MTSRVSCCSEASTRNATTVSYLYDLTGRRSHLRLNGLDVLTYAYQDDGELDTITRAPGVVFDFNPDAAHRRQSVSFPNTTTTEYGYDLLSRLSLIRLKRVATVLNEISYESNDLDNRTSRTENGTRLEYEYDELSRLECGGPYGSTPTVRQEQYSYDSVGNRLTRAGRSGRAGATTTATNCRRYNGINFGYDLNGNQTSRSGSPARTYVWDVENRLTSARDNGVSVASFEYDPLGRRVAKTTSAGLTRFAYDGEDILVENGTAGSVPLRTRSRHRRAPRSRVHGGRPEQVLPPGRPRQPRQAHRRRWQRRELPHVRLVRPAGGPSAEWICLHVSGVGQRDRSLLLQSQILRSQASKVYLGGSDQMVWRDQPLCLRGERARGFRGSIWIEGWPADESKG